MSQPICYRVAPTCSGWEARFDHDASASHFLTRDLAVEAARDAARAHWQLLGSDTCVTIADAQGEVVEDVSFGRTGNPR